MHACMGGGALAALTLLHDALPRLTPPQQRTLALQVAVALDAAGCAGEAAVWRLSVQHESPEACPVAVP